MPSSDPMQAFTAPYAKLAQSNLALFARYALSPEAMSQGLLQMQRLFLQQPPAAPSLPTPSAGQVSELASGLLRNYMTFLLELGQSGMGWMQQWPAQSLRSVREATSLAAPSA